MVVRSRRSHYQEYRSKLNSVNWDAILHDTNTDTVVDNITSSILLAASTSIPNKNVTIRPDTVPWMTNEAQK